MTCLGSDAIVLDPCCILIHMGTLETNRLLLLGHALRKYHFDSVNHGTALHSTQRPRGAFWSICFLHTSRMT